MKVIFAIDAPTIPPFSTVPNFPERVSIRLPSWAERGRARRCLPVCQDGRPPGPRIPPTLLLPPRPAFLRSAHLPSSESGTGMVIVANTMPIKLTYL
ncbi:hypothetical protein E2C01_019024 [Portunus trituberculatus]|uniref:Uncharacterized protein n=1 Tax=Portunus trituberculatus TaxID=210409 RepID=A0A5B7DWK4_PORTR|nr:hypothetical protein [Portunus trituberculatus]